VDRFLPIPVFRNLTILTSKDLISSGTCNHGQGVAMDCHESRFKRSQAVQVTLGKLFAHAPLSSTSGIWYRSKVSDALWLGRSWRHHASQTSLV